MARTVPEWVGKTDDSAPSEKCKNRIVERQGNRCALSGVVFRPGDRIEFDHKTPLWLGGANRESNIQAVISTAHKAKTKAEATVRAKVNAQKSAHLGLKSAPKKKLQSAPFAKSEKQAKRVAKPDFTRRRNPFTRQEIAP